VPHIDLWEPCCFTKVPDGPPDSYSWCPLPPRKRSPNTRVWVKPKLHMHKECGPSFQPLLHTSHTVGCLTTLLGEEVSHLRVLCPVRRPVTALDCVLLKDRNLALAPRQGPEISSRACLWVSARPRVTSDYKYLIISSVSSFLPSVTGIRATFYLSVLTTYSGSLSTCTLALYDAAL